MRSKMARVWGIGLIGAAASLLVSSSPKEVWQWTLEERIADRTNAALARERVDSSKPGQPQNAENLATIVDRFNGKSHPELFLPHEAFETFVTFAFSGDPRASQGRRDAMTGELGSRGFPPDFWERLRSITAIYVADTNVLQDLGVDTRQANIPRRHRAESALELKQKDLCRSSADAFAAARDQFGREKLDRFLYEVIAVHMFYAADRLPDPKLLRRVAEGCR